ncbi:MAG: type II toxin-antitoxin system RelE/ParE family toxin [Desulfobacterales bacterium]|nr:type II toxin-antitoxin system RelE/ParE family toxin [Desulfobacterales bacterium]
MYCNIFLVKNSECEELPKKADKCPSLTGKFVGLKKCRVGDYRDYPLIGDTVLILRIRHRREAYR